MPYFLIVCPGRSGSSSVRLTINSASDTICYGEILGENRVLGVAEKDITREELAVIRANDPDRFIQILLKDAPQTHVGFKALYSHFFVDQNEPYIDWFLSQNPKVIFLWRRNLVKRFLSEWRMRMLDVHKNEEKFARIRDGRVVRDARLQMQMARDIRAWLVACGVSDILDVDFEDMVADPDITHNLMSFLGLADLGYEIHKDPRTLRNEKNDRPVETPAGFLTPKAQRFADVSLDQALQYNDDFKKIIPWPPARVNKHLRSG